jgi:hypothetical protein
MAPSELNFRRRVEATPSRGLHARSKCAEFIVCAMLFLPGAEKAIAQPARPIRELPMFMGRQVTVFTSGTDARGVSPKGPASVCVEGPPKRQCHTAPEAYGLNPQVALVQIDKNTTALFFSAESGGSGSGIHFALLRPGRGNDLEDFFLSDIAVSNQSRHAFRSDASTSDSQIFVTADYVWGHDESHYERIAISSPPMSDNLRRCSMAPITIWKTAI